MHAVPPHELGISAVTEHEIRYGMARQPRVAATLAQKVKSFLSVVQVLPYESRDAIASSSIQARLDRSGAPIGPLDVLIAGVATARDLVLVTSNERAFERVTGLSLENWR